MDDPVPVLAPPRRETRNTPARVALGFNVKEDALDDRSVGDADSPTAVVDGTLVRTASGSAGFDSDDGEKTSLLSAKELTVPNHDIRIMLKNGSSKPMEVLRSHMVTSLTLSMKPEWFMKHQHVFSRSSRLLLGGSSLPEEMTQNDLYNKLDDPNEYREVVMKLADLQYIRVKAVVNVNEAGDIDEREYWLPLNKSQTVVKLRGWSPRLTAWNRRMKNCSQTSTCRRA